MKPSLIALCLLLLVGCGPVTVPERTPSYAPPTPADLSMSSVERHAASCGDMIGVNEPLKASGLVVPWRCGDVRAGQGTPEVPLSRFTRTGTTRQGLATWAYDTELYVATNGTRRWQARVVVIDVPAGTAGFRERTAVVFQVETREGPRLEAQVEQLVLTP